MGKAPFEVFQPLCTTRPQLRQVLRFFVPYGPCHCPHRYLWPLCFCVSSADAWGVKVTLHNWPSKIGDRISSERAWPAIESQAKPHKYPQARVQPITITLYPSGVRVEVFGTTELEDLRHALRTQVLKRCGDSGAAVFAVPT